MRAPFYFITEIGLNYTAGCTQLEHSQMEGGSLHRMVEEKFGDKGMPDFVLQKGLEWWIERMLPVVCVLRDSDIVQ